MSNEWTRQHIMWLQAKTTQKETFSPLLCGTFKRHKAQHVQADFWHDVLLKMPIVGTCTGLIAFAMLFGTGCGGGGASRAVTPTATPTASVPRDVVSSQEEALARLIFQNSGQKRSAWHYNRVLAQVARARAEDFTQRDYFDDVSPDGLSANTLVRQAGYTLPANYSTDSSANEVESIGAAGSDPEEVFTALLNRRNSRLHLLGETPFFAAQTEYGIGYLHDDSSVYKDYWVIITAAPPEG